MPYCSYCKGWIERMEPYYRCTACRRYFCDTCGKVLERRCPICTGIPGMEERSVLRHFIPA